MVLVFTVLRNSKGLTLECLVLEWNIELVACRSKSEFIFYVILQRQAETQKGLPGLGGRFIYVNGH